MTSGPEAGRTIRLVGRKVTLGRGDAADVALSHPTLSRVHASISGVDGTWVLRDAGSRNGTLRNGQPVGFGAVLQAGDGVQLGALRMRVAALDAAEVVALEEAYARPTKTHGPGEEAPIMEDPCTVALFAQAARVAVCPLAVLLLGETGSGKEILARAVHVASNRGGPFLAFNCAALQESLADAELFGHERGAFTGADRARIGLVEAAEGGTLFLDEVGELSASMQARLLRVLEEKQVTPVGGRTPRRVDVRFVAATHRDLETDVDAGRFRADLYYRLAGVVLEVPPLRRRLGEIPLLATRFARARGADLSFTPEVMDCLRRYPWPGNVRELRNVVERAAALSEDGRIGLEHLPEKVRSGPVVRLPTSDRMPNADLRSQLEDIERGRILACLERHEGNQSRAAAELGMPRRTLVTRLSAWGLTRKRGSA